MATTPPGEARSSRYPVVFRTEEDGQVAGALVITDHDIVLSGRGRGKGSIERTIPCADIERARIGHEPGERLNGHATVVLDRRGGTPVLIAPYGVQLLHEIHELLAALGSHRSPAAARVDLVVPLKPGSRERARELVADGPPFELSGFAEHQVYLGADDVVFSFAGPEVERAVQQAMTRPEVWRAGIAWRRCIAGRPEAAPPGFDPADGRELIFSWP